ncbi:hypothetical protein Hanom_Chr08g00745461 [Helianthus anomalus]
MSSSFSSIHTSTIKIPKLHLLHITLNITSKLKFNKFSLQSLFDTHQQPLFFLRFQRKLVSSIHSPSSIHISNPCHLNTCVPPSTTTLSHPLQPPIWHHRSSRSFN